MNLYHFTTLAALGISEPGKFDLSRAWPDGILPMLAKTEDQLWVCDKPVVWLTADPTPGDKGAGTVVRIAVRIPSTDRRLVTCSRWMERKVGKERFRDKLKTNPPPYGGAGLAWRMYFGPVPLTAITGMAVTPCPWWFRPADGPELEAAEARIMAGG